MASLSSADSTDASFADWFHDNPSGTAAQYVTSIGGMANTGAGTSWNDIHSGSHDFISAADTIVLGSTNTTDKRVVVSVNNLTGVTYGSVFNLMDWSTLGLTHDDSALSAMGAFSVTNNLQLQDISSISPGLAWDTSLFDSYGIIVVVPEPDRLLFLMLGLLGLLARRRRRVLA
ncbi:MAG: PEP-CTERM sorting domain-containing protein [Prosthecobacter sp.]|uniref:PEP-CTERM sorting domain-containing protein n=1 Tax=Prosthecobacter sp. TaxID=1965333 RepID=UPI003BB1CA71